MSTYRVLRTNIWRDGWFGELEPLGQHVFMYLLSSPDGSACGAFRTTPKTIASDTNIDRSQIPAILRRLCEPGADGRVRVSWWPDLEMVFVHNFYEHNKSNPKFELAAARCADQLPEPLRGAVFARYPQFPSAIDNAAKRKRLSAGDQTLSEPFGYGIDTVSRPYAGPADTVAGPSEYPMDTTSKPYANPTDSVSAPYADLIDTVSRPYANPIDTDSVRARARTVSVSAAGAESARDTQSASLAGASPPAREDADAGISPGRQASAAAARAKPTRELVRRHFQALGHDDQADLFFAYYAETDWVGVTNWRYKAEQWVLREGRQFSRGSPGRGREPARTLADDRTEIERIQEQNERLTFGRSSCDE